ncbi:MAG: D-alanyl-D-alanine carboxypeptidase [Firmicutes bacterium]|nr:D-alanyl-D-alanine carboxypeptidase [Bacillota bacterium]
MKKVVFFLFSLFFFCYSVYAENFDITGEYVSLYNMNEDILLYSKNDTKKTSIASLTKMMTTLVAIEEINDLDEIVTIKERDFDGTVGYSKAGFKVGNKVTYRDLLYGIILPSGADAVNAVVNNTLGYDKFIKKMNETAKRLGMNDTSYANPVGKDDENNYSTSSDLAKLLKYALKNETFKTIFTTKSYKTSNGINLESTVNSYKNILNTDEIKGAKSGFTKDAGRCLASITTLNNVDYLLVVINSSTTNPYNAVKDTITIYDYYNNNYGYKNIINDDTFIKEIPVDFSKEKTYKITGSEDIEKYLKNNTEVTYKYVGSDKVTFNTKKGSKLGVVKIYDGDVLLATSNVYLENNIEYYPIITYIMIGIAVIFVLLIVKKIKKKKHRRRRR